MIDIRKLNDSQLTEQDKQKQRSADISKAITSEYTIDAQLAILFNAIELIVADMKDCEHKQELLKLLAFRKQVKKEV